MLSPAQPDRIHVAFDDHRLVANAGLLLPVTLGHHLGLGELVDCHVDLGDAPGRANAGDKMLTLVASALAGGDCIDDAAALRAGGTARVLGCVVKAPSTLGTFLRSFRWGHARQLDRVSRELLARAWAAGAGPGDGPLTIDLDSTLCETYGLCKEGARHHGYTGQRGYHPILAVAAGTGDVLMARLREGRANTARGAAHFLRETVGRVRHAGATGPLTMRADSGFYTHAIVAACRKMKVRFSITVRQRQGLRNLIEAIPEGDWTPIPYWMEGAAAVAETEYTPFQGEPDAVPVRLIVRRVKPTPGSQLALFTNYSYHAFITDREGDTLDLEADHRRHAEIENAIRDLKYGVGLNHLPSGRFPANAAWLAVQVMAHNLNSYQLWRRFAFLRNRRTAHRLGQRGRPGRAGPLPVRVVGFGSGRCPSCQRPSPWRGCGRRRLHQLLRRQQRQAQAHYRPGKERPCQPGNDRHAEGRHGAGGGGNRRVHHPPAAHGTHAPGSAVGRRLYSRALPRPAVPSATNPHHRRPLLRPPGCLPSGRRAGHLPPSPAPSAQPGPTEYPRLTTSRGSNKIPRNVAPQVTRTSAMSTDAPV